MSYSYIGQAVTYPITLDKGTLQVSKGLSVIENAIVKILTTPIGTRYFVPEYGCRLSELQYEPNDEILVRELRVFILDALTKWETRAEFIDVETILITDAVICVIQYRVLQSSEVSSFVWPFYKNLIS